MTNPDRGRRARLVTIRSADRDSNLESTPRGQTHWSTRELASASGLSRMTISRIWRAFGLPPHRNETFKLSPDPLLVEKVRDIAGLYMNPPDHALSSA
jgi:hypothetical protein